MAEHPAATLLAPHLGRLQHTNANGEVGTVCLPGFANAGMSEGQQQTTGLLALAIAEATVETLEKVCHYRVVPESEFKGLLKKAQTATPADDIELTCNRCRRPILRVNAARGKLDVGITVRDLLAHQEQCR